MTMKQAWLGFWLLALIWGSSFLFIRIGVEQLPPFQLVFIRTGIAAVGLIGVVYLRGKRLHIGIVADVHHLSDNAFGHCHGLIGRSPPEVLASQLLQSILIVPRLRHDFTI